MRTYFVRVIAEDGTSYPFHRSTNRSIRKELSLLYDEFPKSRRIEIEIARPRKKGGRS